MTLIVYFQYSSTELYLDSSSAFDAKIANQVMNDISDSSKFSLFVFGKSRVPRDRYYRRQCFVRRQNLQNLSGQSPSGGADGVAVQIEAQLAKYLVTECDLMDFSHELTLKKSLVDQHWVSRYVLT